MSATALLEALGAWGADTPGPAARAAAALERVLAGIEASPWPEAAWRFSQLCPAGWPVELVWRPGWPGVAWVAEIGGPEIDERARLDRAAGLATALGRTPPDVAWMAHLAALQAGTRLRWGAWLGGRHDGACDRAKLYAELPPLEPGALGRLFAGAAPWLATLPQAARARLAAHEPASGRTELYLRIPAYAPGDLYAPLKAAGMADGALPALLARLCGIWPEAALEGRGIGLSLALDVAGAMDAMAVILVARSLPGGEARLRGRALGLASGGGPARLWASGGLAATLLTVAGRRDGSARFSLGFYPKRAAEGRGREVRCA
jgi:hypothetical protein